MDRKNPAEFIYLQIEEEEVPWCEDAIHDSDVRYTRSDIVDKKIKELEEQLRPLNLLVDEHIGLKEFAEQENLKLEIKVKELEEALTQCLQWFEWWLDDNVCECENDHTCGKNERILEYDKLRKVLDG